MSKYTTYSPNEADKREMKGRLRQIMELHEAIKNGDVVQMADVEQFIQRMTDNMHTLINSNEWVIGNNYAVDVKGTRERADPLSADTKLRPYSMMH